MQRTYNRHRVMCDARAKQASGSDRAAALTVIIVRMALLAGIAVLALAITID